MNPELPNLIKQALARPTPGDVHPSADVLTAFAEHSLPHRERRQVSAHMARCGECREVVFLASSAVEEPIGDNQEWMPANAVPRLSPALLAKAEAAPATTPQAETRRGRGWTLWWAWIPAVAVVLLVSGVLILKRSEFTRAAPVNVASNRAASASRIVPETAATAPGAPTEQPAAPTSSVPLELRNPARAEARHALVANNLAPAKAAPAIPGERSPAPAPTALPEASSSDVQQAVRNALETAPPERPMQNSFAEREPQASGFVAKPHPALGAPAMMRGVSSHSQWRISPDGHLEHLTAPGVWARVLTDQPPTFHVVSVVGDDVWAGGSGGSLFHSRDGGQNWSKVQLGAARDKETGTIVSIQFSDAKNGVITTDLGLHWTTSDGGDSWTQQ